MGEECRPARARSRVRDVTAPVRPDCSAKSCIRETESGNTTTFGSAAQQLSDGLWQRAQSDPNGSEGRNTAPPNLVGSNWTATEKLIRASKCQQGGVMPLTTQTLHLRNTFSITAAEIVGNVTELKGFSFIICSRRIRGNTCTILHSVGPINTHTRILTCHFAEVTLLC